MRSENALEIARGGNDAREKISSLAARVVVVAVVVDRYSRTQSQNF